MECPDHPNLIDNLLFNDVGFCGFVHSHVSCLSRWKASEKSGKRCDEHEVSTCMTSKTHDNPHPCSWRMLRLSHLLCRLKRGETSGQRNNQGPAITCVLLRATNVGLLISCRVSQEALTSWSVPRHGSWVTCMLVRTTNIGFWSYTVNLGMAAPSGAPFGAPSGARLAPCLAPRLAKP